MSLCFHNNHVLFVFLINLTREEMTVTLVLSGAKDLIQEQMQFNVSETAAITKIKYRHHLHTFFSKIH